MFRSSLLWPFVRPAALQQRRVPEPALARAFDFFSERLEAGIETLDQIHYTSAQRELETLNQSEELCDADWERARHLAKHLHSFSNALEDFNDAYFGLIALSFLTSRQERAVILKELADATWLEKMEVMARWGWMKKHDELLKKGAEIEGAFLCRVPPRNKRANVDREFDTFLRFSHGLKIATGEELLFIEKREGPDFAAETRTGQIVGTEVGEAPLSQDWADDEDAMATVHEAFREIMGGTGCNLLLQDPPPGRFWLERLDPLRAVLRQAVDELPRQQKKIRNEALRLRAELAPAKSESRIFSQDQRGEIRDDFRQQEEAVAVAIVKAIRKKLERPEKNGKRRPRKGPEIRPCYLVLYPNYDFILDDVNRALELARNKLRDENLNPLSHFDQVWLTSESFIHRVG